VYKYKAKLIRVVDGDTIDAEIDLGFKIYIKERIRLAGIDTPESRTRNLKEKSWGKAATRRVIELLDVVDGEFLLATELQKKGKFGRILGRIMLPLGKEVNEILIEEGLAIRYYGGNKDLAKEDSGVKELWETTYYEEHTK
jgi:micrococcal nuclease